ncbi:hypothetical protein D3C81_1825700 [compost metagenome]
MASIRDIEGVVSEDCRSIGAWTAWPEAGGGLVLVVKNIVIEVIRDALEVCGSQIGVGAGEFSHGPVVNKHIVQEIGG